MDTREYVELRGKALEYDGITGNAGEYLRIHCEYEGIQGKMDM